MVPIDDTNTYVIAWRNLNRRDDPEGQAKRGEIGWESVDFYGQSAHRPYEQRQDQPGDWDAWVSQGPINSHIRENPAWTDQGVARLRRALRDGIRNVQKGREPPRPERHDGIPVPTFAGDTVLRIPKGPGDDRALILDVSRKIAESYLEFQDLPDAERRGAIEKKLALLNVR